MKFKYQESTQKKLLKRLVFFLIHFKNKEKVRRLLKSFVLKNNNLTAE